MPDSCWLENNHMKTCLEEREDADEKKGSELLRATLVLIPCTTLLDTR